MEIIEKIEACRVSTLYQDSQIELMKRNAVSIYAQILKLKGTTYILHDIDKNGKEVETHVVLDFEKIVFHHSFMMMWISDSLVKKAWKELFIEMKKIGTIGSVTTNGYGTAFVIDYEPWLSYGDHFARGYNLEVKYTMEDLKQMA